MKTIRVQLKPSYDVLIGKGLLAGTGARIERLLRPSRVIVIASRRVQRLHGRTLLSGFRTRPTVITLPDGEAYKRVDVLRVALEKMLQAGADRKSCVVAFGGGMTGDLAGLAASLYMRGIPVVQVPTTLLAQVDAAIGGKTAVNLPAAKNIVGTFHQPRLVVSDTDVLGTLADREYCAGIFEIVKCAAIRDARLFRFLESNAGKLQMRDAGVLARVIAAAVKVKAQIVAADEKESGLRRILNFGHTIGHALEAAGDYQQLLHGEAVGLGMIAAAEIGVNVGVTPPELAERIIAGTLRFGPLPVARVRPETVLRALMRDKKAERGVPHFVLIDKLGSTVIRRDVPMKLVRDAIRSVCA